MKNEKYAFFDLDHTLLPYDTQLLFCNFILKKYPLRRFLMPFILLTFPLCALIGGRKLMKRAYLSFLIGFTSKTLDKESKIFAKLICEKLLFKKIFKEINTHKKSGTILILNTASPSIYPQHISDLLNFDYCFSTNLKKYKKMPIFPKIIGKNNKDIAKIPPMINKIFPKHNEKCFLKNSYSYSDSITDVPLLEIAENKILINPNKKFEKWGKNNNAKIYKLAHNDLIGNAIKTNHKEKKRKKKNISNTHIKYKIKKITTSLLLLFGLYPIIK